LLGGKAAAAIVLAWSLFLSACPAPVSLPQIKPESETGRGVAVPHEPPARGNPSLKRIPLEAIKVAVYQAGDRNELGIRVTPELAAAYAAYHRRDIDGALAALDAVAAKAADPLMRWVAASLRFDALHMLGRPADAEAVATGLATLEQELLGHDLTAQAMRGLARLELADYDSALADFGRVVRAIDRWSLPTSYSGPPTNLVEVKSLSEAQMRAYAGIASIHFLQKNYSAALRWAEATEGLFNDLFYVLTHPLYGSGFIPSGVGEGRAYNLTILGAARSVVQKEPRAGVGKFEAAKRFFASINHAHGLAVVQAVAATVAEELGRLEDAERIAQEGERVAAAAGLGDMVWRLAAERGRALLALGRREEAEKAFRSAQNGIELASGSLASEGAKIRFGTGKEEVTRYLIIFDLDKGDHAALFRDMERARARAFIDLLGDRPVAHGRQVDLVAAIRASDRQILRQRLLNGAPGGVPDGAAREANLIAKRTERARELRARDPEIADTLSVAVAELKDVQGRLEAGESLIYAIPGGAEESLRLLIVTRDSTDIINTDFTHSGLAGLVTQMAGAVRGLDLRRHKSVANSMGQGLKIAKWPVRKAAYVVPSGALHFVPWGALDVGYPVAVLPAAGWLLRVPVSMGVTKAAAIVGDPDFRGAFKQLEGARKEAIEIGKLYGTEPLLGLAASEETLRGQVGGGVDILHFATHGFFDAANPLASFILLSGREQPQKLTAAKLFENPLPARLVVLSACETGVGKTVAGDDFLGLPRSFYLGGTLAVVSSLWPVDDFNTKLFMETFHRRAKSGDYGGAWLEARDRLRAAGVPPLFYGAFVLGGALKG
jgi:tetratricopeptide (TPR) repeat protein